MTIAIILLLIGYIIFSKMNSQNKKTEDVESDSIPINTSKLPYKKKEYLMTTAERSFYGVLSLVLKDSRFCIFSKVRLADLLYLPNNTINRQAYWNKLQSKHVDFLICDKKLLKPLLVVALDDASHSYSERVECDIFVNQALQEAGLNIVRIKAANTYVINEVEQLIIQYLEPAAEKNEAAAAIETSTADEAVSNKETVPLG